MTTPNPYPSRRRQHAKTTANAESQTDPNSQVEGRTSGAPVNPSPADPAPGESAPVDQGRPSSGRGRKRRRETAPNGLGRAGRGRRLAPSRAETRRRWTIGVAVFGLLITAALVLFGFMAQVATRPAVLSVEGPLDMISVEGRQGAAPVVTVSGPVAVSSVKMRVQIRGDGPPLTPETPALVAITAFDGSDGSNLNVDGTANLILGAPTEEDLGPLLSRILEGQTEGSRLVIARPMEDGRTEIDIVDILYTIASGTATEAAEGPLSVTFDELGPLITHWSDDAPTELTLQVLAEGDGPQVQADDTVVVQYVVGTWGSGDIVSSTWSNGSPAMIDLNEAMPGIAGALIDQRVGTRLAATVPAEMATGEDTLVMVVDILGRMSSDVASTETVGEE